MGAASFLTVDWAASPGMAEQHVKVRPIFAHLDERIMMK